MKSHVQSYMEELDGWTDDHVLVPVFDAFQSDDPASLDKVAVVVRKAVRAKVFESYHNGQSRCPNCGGTAARSAENLAKRSYKRPFPQRER